MRRGGDFERGVGTIMQGLELRRNDKKTGAGAGAMAGATLAMERIRDAVRKPLEKALTPVARGLKKTQKIQITTKLSIKSTILIT